MHLSRPECSHDVGIEYDHQCALTPRLCSPEALPQRSKDADIQLYATVSRSYHVHTIARPRLLLAPFRIWSSQTPQMGDILALPTGYAYRFRSPESLNASSKSKIKYAIDVVDFQRRRAFASFILLTRKGDSLYTVISCSARVQALGLSLKRLVMKVMDFCRHICTVSGYSGWLALWL